MDAAGESGVLRGGDVISREPARAERSAAGRNARAFFPYGRRIFWWDSLDQTYFAGYALWNYLVFPALLLREDIRWQEPGPNRLMAAFPGSIPTHSPVQEFLFDPTSGLLQQHNYTAEVMGGWARAANVIVEHGAWNGIPYPSHRRVTPRKKDGTPAGGARPHRSCHPRLGRFARFPFLTQPCRTTPFTDRTVAVHWSCRRTGLTLVKHHGGDVRPLEWIEAVTHQDEPVRN